MEENKEFLTDVAEALSETEETVDTNEAVETEETVDVSGPMERRVPVLALRGLMLYPGLVMHFDAGRRKSVRALERMADYGDSLLLLTQRDVDVDEPGAADLYETGTVSIIKQKLRLPDGTMRVLAEGVSRARVDHLFEEDGCLMADVTIFPEQELEFNDENQAKVHVLAEMFEEYAAVSKKIGSDALNACLEVADPGLLTDNMAALMPMDLEDKMLILSVTEVGARMDLLMSLLQKETDISRIEKKIRRRVKEQMDDNQQEYYLKEQLRAIRKELGEDEDEDELNELYQKIQDKVAPEAVKNRLKTEFQKLKKMPPYVAEYFVERTYIETLLDLPYGVMTEDKLDLVDAKAVLDEDHYGLMKVKERILEYLAVRKMKDGQHGPILCLVGPPGVGKTSLAQSVARSMGRKFIRVALGGMRDEAEIRGHRKTYVGAMPGRIIQNIKMVGSDNPVFLLDEIDKLSSDFKGDPASAILEVLDPAQNHTFTDNYVELPYDLSKVFFITTANTTAGIPRPLLDRMEVINLSGYTEDEKLQIALRYLIPKQLKEHGLEAAQVRLSEATVRAVIRRYTRESGVRELDRQIAGIMRKVVRRVLENKAKSVRVTPENLENFLGIARFQEGERRGEDRVGCVSGLAWTEVGGDVLLVEVTTFAGKGEMKLTGQLGDVMQESAKTAASFVRSVAEDYGIDSDYYYKTDIHLHVPEGAIPKDGPSAGITMATALMSALTKKPVDGSFAMTGEITLTGRVLPIGGLKEKTLAAHRAGYTHIIIPRENRKDLEEIPRNIKKDLTFHPVSDCREVFELVLKEK